MFKLIKKYRGKETIVMIGQLPKVNDYKKKMLSCQRGGIKGHRVEYFIVPAEEDDKKYKMRPHNINLSGQTGPKVIQK